MGSSGWDARYGAAEGLVWGAAPNRLRGAAAALRPGGTLVNVGHDEANLADGIGGPQDPAVLQRPDRIVAELAGLRIRRAQTCRRPVPQAGGGTRDALDTVVVAQRP